MKCSAQQSPAFSKQFTSNCSRSNWIALVFLLCSSQVLCSLICTSDALSPLVICAWTEHWLVFILGSLPPLRPLSVHMLQRISGISSTYRKTDQGYNRQKSVDHIAMGPLANENAPCDTDSERHILPREAGILRTTYLEVRSSLKTPQDSSNARLHAMETGLTF